jgi:hypothetical protein
MFIPPPPTKQHWVYDDPSGVAEPTPYLRRWHPRVPQRTPRITLVRSNRVRVAHREG